MKSSYLEGSFIKEKEQEVLKCIEKLKDDILPIKSKEKMEYSGISDEDSDYRKKLLLDIDILKGSTSDAKIEKEWKTEIETFAKRFMKEIPDDFWNVGDLTVTRTLSNPILGMSGISYNGTDEEKERYCSIESVYWKIIEINEYRSYFEILDNYKLIELVLANQGTTFDEDIDVKLYIPKGKIIMGTDIPFPGRSIIDVILENNFINTAFKIRENDMVNCYTEYPSIQPRFKYNITTPFAQPSAQEEYAEKKEEYQDAIRQVWCYEVFEKPTEDVIQFHVSYLKHNTKIAFPAVLAFQELPESIGYEITSKHIASVIKGNLIIL